MDLKRNRGSRAKQVQWNEGDYSVSPFQEKMWSVPPWKKFFWPGLKIPRAGGLASSAGSLFQSFTSLTDKKHFLVCNSLHGQNREPETEWEDEFSDRIWAFVWTGFGMWDIQNGWIRVRAKWTNVFLFCPSCMYPRSPRFLHELCGSPLMNVKVTT